MLFLQSFIHTIRYAHYGVKLYLSSTWTNTKILCDISDIMTYNVHQVKSTQQFSYFIPLSHLDIDIHSII